MPASVLTAVGVAGAGLITFGAVMGIRKLIQIGQFAYQNSRLSTLGNPYVMKDEVLPLVEIRSPQILSKSISSDLVQGMSNDTFRDVDASLIIAFHDLIGSMVDGSPVSIRPFLEAYVSRIEGEELKRILRYIGKRKEPLFPVGRIDEDIERQMLSSKDLLSALEVIGGLPVAKRVSEVVRNEEKIHLFKIDDAIDRYCLDVFSSIQGVPFTTRRGIRAFYDILCDRYNIHTILRSKRTDLERDATIRSLYPGGGILGRPALEQMVDSSGPREVISILSGTHMELFLKDIDPTDITSLETALDRVVLEGVKGLSHSYGSSIGPTIRYLFSKEMELKNLRIIYQASFSGWDAERTKKLLVLEGAL